jgi:hypothetical protein
MFVLTYHNADDYSDGASVSLAVSERIESLFAAAASHQLKLGNDAALIRLSWRKGKNGATGTLREAEIGQLSDHYQINLIAVV